jgi:hypothetical protein
MKLKNSKNELNDHHHRGRRREEKKRKEKREKIKDPHNRGFQNKEK